MKNAMSDMLIKMLLALAMLVILLLVFPGNLYNQAKGWLDEQFDPMKNAGKVTEYSATRYMQHTAEDITSCVEKTARSCICPFRFELTNDDYSMQLESTHRYRVKDDLPIVSASIRDKEGKVLGKETDIAGSGCLLTATPSPTVSMENPEVTEQEWVPEIRHGIILRHTVRSDGPDIHQSDPWSDPYPVLTAVSGGKEYVVEGSLYKTDKGYACLYTEEYINYLRQEGSAMPRC